MRQDGDGGQVAWTIYGFESLWLPASLLEDDSQERLADALFAGSRYELIELHFNKGLAGAPREAIEAARNTATNPAALSAFALAIVADGAKAGIQVYAATSRTLRQRESPASWFMPA